MTNSEPRAERRKRAAHLLFAAAFLVAGVAVFLPVLTGPAQAAADPAVRKTVTATRVFIDQDGTETAAGSHDVTLEVAQTDNLRGRQEIAVSWSGAIPTGGVVSDPNSSEGRLQEYPFVLLQCRGVDAADVPAGQEKLSPETCWTQTSAERYMPTASHTPSWRFDAYAAEADRAAVVGAPDSLPASCESLGQPLTARWLPLRAMGGEVYYGGPDPSVGCVGMAPESDNAEGGGLPSNTTYGITGKDGNGKTDFAVWTGAENATLGCSATVSCSLVAVPIVGLSCDAYGNRLPAGSAQTTRTGTPLSATQLAAADTACRRTGAYVPGESQSSTLSDLSVRGSMWWSESNWRNRITVPLSFALTGSVCDAVSEEAPQDVMGSVVANELTASWRPKFCTSKNLFTFTHVQQSDALARTLVNVGEIDAALTSAPREGGYSRPVVQAPVAVGGFGIAFSIDDTNKQRRENLNLNARLVAKLLSSSYPALPVVKDNHPSIGDNPYNISLDPEFQALNPGLPATSNAEAAAALQIFSSSSDLVWALTSWIDSDPEARAWLDGYPDPWGMKVNENYRKISLPVDNWPLLDDFLAPQYYQDQNACYANSPTPFMQLIANPQANLSAVLLNMQFASSTVQTVCKYDGGDPTTLPLRKQGRQPVGSRFVLGLVSLSAAERYNLRTAALQTTSTVSPSKQFDSADGRSFVAPDVAGFRAGAALLTADPASVTWTLNYPALKTEEGGAAYPGTMPIYAVVPTEGLEPETATKMAKLLCYAHDDGQQPGLVNGQLPPGYLPITKTNGLVPQRDYLLSSVAAVRAQVGDVPALDAETPKRNVVCDFKKVKPTPSASPSPSPTESDEPPAVPDVSVPGVTIPSAAPEASAPPAAEPSSAAPSATAPVVEAQPVLTSGQTSVFGRLGTPGLLLFALMTALIGSLMRWYEPIMAGLATAGPRAKELARRGAQRGRKRGGKRR